LKNYVFRFQCDQCKIDTREHLELFIQRFFFLCFEFRDLAFTQRNLFRFYTYFVIFIYNYCYISVFTKFRIKKIEEISTVLWIETLWVKSYAILAYQMFKII
jgi:hypothetical protein